MFSGRTERVTHWAIFGARAAAAWLSDEDLVDRLPARPLGVMRGELGRRLAPLYDLDSTAVYNLDGAMSMSIGEVFEPEAFLSADWIDMSADCHL